MTGNRPSGSAPTQHSPAPPGGSGGTVYTEGDNYHVLVEGTIIRRNTAREGGGAIFFVVDNPPATPGIFFHSSGHPVVIGSTISGATGLSAGFGDPLSLKMVGSGQVELAATHGGSE